jgi:hypothetical protein
MSKSVIIFNPTSLVPGQQNALQTPNIDNIGNALLRMPDTFLLIRNKSLFYLKTNENIR